MGNIYSQLIVEATKLKSAGKLPAPDRIPQHYFSKSEIKIYQMIRDLYADPSFRFVMNSAQFIKFLQDWFECENDETAEQIINAIGIPVPSLAQDISFEERKGGGSTRYSASKTKINTFDFLTLIIIFSKWSIGIKLDMLLILFDTQSNDSINISELLIMIKTIMRVMSNYSTKGSDYINFNLISDEQLEIYVENTCCDFIQKVSLKILRDFERNDGVISTEGEGFVSAFQHYRGASAKPAPAIDSKRKKSVSSFSNSAFAGIETLNEKKYRIFKWKFLEKHKMQLLYVKHKLIESIEAIIFFNLVNPIKTCLFSWGFNGHYQNGVQFTKSIRHTYDLEITEIRTKRSQSRFSSNSLGGKNEGKNTSQESADELDDEETGIKKYPSMSEEDDIKDKSISDVNEYDTNITISKVNKIEKSKTQKPKSQLTLPKVRDSSLFINDVSRQEKFLNAIISNDQKSNFDYTKELNYMCNLMKSQQILSNWFRNDYIKSKVVNDAENYENFDNLSHINSIQKIEVPRLNYEMLDKNIKFVCGKRFVNFYLSQKGEIYSSGKNICGVLGREGTKQGSRFYTQTLMEISAESKIKLVKSGLKHAICLTETNEIYTWGYNNLGQLGLNLNETKANIKSEINFETGEIFNYINTPEPIPFFLKNNRSILISEISCGNDFTIALTTAGKLYGWGDNTFNQLGVNNQTSSIISQSQDEGKFFIEEPVQISCMIDSKRDLANISKEESRIESIICGTEYSYAISQDLKCFFWGRSKYGLNLKSNTLIEKKPLHLYLLDGKKIKTLATCDNHTLALGHCVEATFTHPSMPKVKISIKGIPNDGGVMDIDFFKIDKECDVFVVNEGDLPYVLLKRKIKRMKLKKRDRERIFQNIINRDMENTVQETEKEADNEEEESEEENNSEDSDQEDEEEEEESDEDTKIKKKSNETKKKQEKKEKQEKKTKEETKEEKYEKMRQEKERKENEKQQLALNKQKGVLSLIKSKVDDSKNASKISQSLNLDNDEGSEETKMSNLSENIKKKEQDEIQKLKNEQANLFKESLNKTKPYYKDMEKFEVIAEVNSNDELSTVRQSIKGGEVLEAIEDNKTNLDNLAVSKNSKSAQKKDIKATEVVPSIPQESNHEISQKSKSDVDKRSSQTKVKQELKAKITEDEELSGIIEEDF